MAAIASSTCGSEGNAHVRRDAPWASEQTREPTPTRKYPSHERRRPKHRTAFPFLTRDEKGRNLIWGARASAPFIRAIATRLAESVGKARARGGDVEGGAGFPPGTTAEEEGEGEREEEWEGEGTLKRKGTQNRKRMGTGLGMMGQPGLPCGMRCRAQWKGRDPK